MPIRKGGRNSQEAVGRPRPAVLANGSKLWQLVYQFGGKQRQLSLGPYPEVTLSEARSRRDLAKALLRDGKDPAEEWRQPAADERLPGDTFKEVALEYIERRRRENLAVPTMIKKKWLLEFAYPTLGRMKVTTSSQSMS